MPYPHPHPFPFCPFLACFIEYLVYLRFFCGSLIRKKGGCCCCCSDPFKSPPSFFFHCVQKNSTSSPNSEKSSDLSDLLYIHLWENYYTRSETKVDKLLYNHSIFSTLHMFFFFFQLLLLLLLLLLLFNFVIFGVGDHP